jgi:hypothetical protein
MIGGGIFLHWSFPVGIIIGIAATVYIYQYQFLLVDYFECFFIKVPPEERRDW